MRDLAAWTVAEMKLDELNRLADEPCKLLAPFYCRPPNPARTWCQPCFARAVLAMIARAEADNAKLRAVCTEAARDIDLAARFSESIIIDELNRRTGWRLRAAGAGK